MATGLHGSARTTPRVRAELQASQESTRALAGYGLSLKIRAWIETHFGWIKAAAGLRQVKQRELERRRAVPAGYGGKQPGASAEVAGCRLSCMNALTGKVRPEPVKSGYFTCPTP